MAWPLLLKMAGKKALMQSGKKIATNIGKKALKAKAKDFVIDNNLVNLKNVAFYE